MEYGELAVNYNEGDPAIFLKDSDNEIVRIAGAGALGTFDGITIALLTSLRLATAQLLLILTAARTFYRHQTGIPCYRWI